MVRFPDFETGIRNIQVLERGELYFLNGQVTDLDDYGDGKYHAYVASENVYSEYGVNIDIVGNRVTNYDCECPYADSAICKHIIAVLMKIRFDKYGISGLQHGNIENVDPEDYEEIEHEEPGFDGIGSASGRFVIAKPKMNPNKEPEIFEILKKAKKGEINANAMGNRSAKKSSHKNEKNQPASIPIQDIGVIGSGILSSRTATTTTTTTNNNNNNNPAVEKEFECQVCLDRFVNPVLMACHVHSVCLQCLHGIYIQKKEEARNSGNGTVVISSLGLSCPTCGEASGIAKFIDLKINKELMKIMDAYDNDRDDVKDNKGVIIKNEAKKAEGSGQDVQEGANVGQGLVEKGQGVKSEGQGTKVVCQGQGGKPEGQMAIEGGIGVTGGSGNGNGKGTKREGQGDKSEGQAIEVLTGGKFDELKLQIAIEKVPVDKISNVAFEAMKIIIKNQIKGKDIEKLFSMVNLKIDGYGSMTREKDISGTTSRKGIESNNRRNSQEKERNQRMHKNKIHPSTEEEILEEMMNKDKEKGMIISSTEDYDKKNYGNKKRLKISACQ